MAETIYVADMTLDRTGGVMLVNGIPTEHAHRTHRVKMPINEFLHCGSNAIEVAPSQLGSNADPRSAGKLSLKVTKDRVNGATLLSSEVLIDEQVDFEAFIPGSTPVLRADFASEIGTGIDRTGLQPIGPAEEELIRARLERFHAAFLDGEVDALVAPLRPYFARYERAYEHVEDGDMASSFARMISAMTEAGASISFEPALNTLRGGQLVDCLGPTGAAIQANASGFPTYDFWLVMGVRHGEAVVVA